MAHALLNDTVDILTDLINFPSISEGGNLELIAYINHRLDQIGVRTYLTLDETGGKANLFATLGPANTDGGIVLSGHTDVVPVEGQEWHSDPFNALVRDGRLYGRGACDMKGFIACTLAMAPQYMQADLKVPLHLGFTYDEEVGCLGARVMLDELREVGPHPRMCIVGEPTMMKLIEGHKGCCEYTTHFSGLEGHGSEPDRGVNAVEYAVRYVARLMEIAEDLRQRVPEESKFVPPHSTIQIGRMAGGIARNIIAGSCAVEWELRHVTADDYDFTHAQIRSFVADTLLPQMQSVYPDANILTQVMGEVAGLAPMEHNEVVELVRVLTGNKEAGELVSFGTEAGLYQQLGVDTVICGPGSIHQAHKPDEFVALEQLDQCLHMIEGLHKHLV